MGAGAAGSAPTLRRVRRLAPPAVWASGRPGSAALPPPAQPAPGAGAGRGRRPDLALQGARGPAGPARVAGWGAWLRSALQCGGGNRFQFVLLLAQRALLAPGTEYSLARLNTAPPPTVFSRLVGLPAAGARCRGATLKVLGAAGYGTTPLRGEFLGAKLPLPSPVRKLPSTPPAPPPSSSHRLPSPPPGTLLQKACLGTSGAPDCSS